MALEVDNIEVTLGGKRVLGEIGFTVQPGMTCLVGPNGAGKSTLLKALAQIIPYRGNIVLDGLELRHLSRSELAALAAYLPQFTQTPLLSVLEMLELGRRPRTGTLLSARDRRAIDELIAHFGLETQLMRPLTNLSGGERQKVLIAATLAQEPSFLMLDEPIAHLDPKNRLEVLRAIADFTYRHRIVTLVVLHEAQQALHFGDTLLLLRHGNLLHHLEAGSVTSEHLEQLYGVPVKLFWEEGHPFLFFGHGHGSDTKRSMVRHHHIKD